MCVSLTCAFCSAGGSVECVSLTCVFCSAGGSVECVCLSPVCSAALAGSWRVCRVCVSHLCVLQRWRVCRVCVSHLCVLQRWLVAGGSVEHPLRRFGVNVSQVKLLQQLMHILLLQPQQLQLVHGEVQRAAAVAPQLVADVGLPRSAAELSGRRRRVTHQTRAVDLIVGLGAASDDPGRLAQTQTAPQLQTVARRGAVVVCVVELKRIKRVVVEETVRASEELRAGTHLAADTENTRIYYCRRLQTQTSHR